MKNFIYIFIALFMFACDSEDANGCLKKTGTIIQDEVAISSFENIFVDRDIELILKQDIGFRVIIETGKNIRKDLEVKVINNELQLKDTNTCNLVREYGVTKIYVSAPGIKVIRSSTQHTISSDGVLHYPKLKLVSEDYNRPESYSIGDFRLAINSQELSVVANNISSFYISGESQNVDINFFSGSGRFQGEDLIAQNINFYHRGSNDMVVNPQVSLTGEIRSTGHVISLNQPATIAVEEFYNGRLIFQ
ncbi:head GIN domain-containing protein [Oceanihabitans sediminis]|uniref:DUF2807 domain-containing protein n=1 Tax=Oceanihabitans sediminis TaxID=1812012 RepID=A0A368P6B3_9FLAO|nr:head GIN domain-containing protein [Oceanihabitans sediminis]MDX1278802.1 head GIN domain-containing protein [Oceanihabitans sediminis]MDX1772620.1 head GIN domain-containing protein [Oceanihabitans sediminis]RBP34287.1 putative autotransporter adhesin-like protein [Oceanihabitans sediminis]RCU57973.1 DUF2807 domain-containing protein [Oceanihabitans sediminis]